jgi:hypothetical protein
MKVLLLLAFGVLLLVPFVAVASIGGSWLGLAFWLAGLLALQPAIWTEGVPTRARVMLWLKAALTGFAGSLALFGLGSFLSRFVSAGVFLWPIAFLVGPFLAFRSCSAACRRCRDKTYEI